MFSLARSFWNLALLYATILINLLTYRNICRRLNKQLNCFRRNSTWHGYITYNLLCFGFMLIAVYLTVGRRFDEQRQQKHSHVVDVCVCRNVVITERWLTLKVVTDESVINCQVLETHMYSLQANVSPAGRCFAAKCRRRSRFGCFSRYCLGPYIPKYQTWSVCLRRPSVPFVLPNFIDIC